MLLNICLFFVQINLNQSVADGKLKDCEITRLKQLVAVQEEKMENMSGKIREFETDRRKLHNTIQELKVKLPNAMIASTEKFV